jgi:hypothetical protein
LSIYNLIYSGAVHFTGCESDALMICVHTLWTTSAVLEARCATESVPSA